MADTIEPTEQDLQTARQGVMTQLRAHCGDATIEVLEAFIENQVNVIAAQRAYIRFLNTCLHSK